MSKVKDEVGNIYGRLHVLERAVSNRGKAMWLCLCECGITTIATGKDLRNGSTVSCKCSSAERAKDMGKQNTKHGLKGSPEYQIWGCIKQRCYNQNATSYENYGGRGIQMCDEWRNDPVAFVAYMGPRPSPIHSIDRINNDGNYEPGNCRWSTPAEQAANQRPHKRRACVYTSRNAKDETGNTYGRLFVLKRAGTKERSRTAMWMCMCDCGNTAVVSGAGLRFGTTLSCGCLRKENMRTVGKSNLGKGARR